jgi:hypothetical protein
MTDSGSELCDQRAVRRARQLQSFLHGAIDTRRYGPINTVRVEL